MYYDDGKMQVGEVVYDVVETIDDDSRAYEWHTGGILRDPDGNLFWLDERGCSCDYFGHYTSASDLIPIKNWQEAVELAKGGWSESYVFDFANRLRNG